MTTPTPPTGQEPPTGPPRWVWVSAAVLVLAVVTVVVLMLVPAAGEHGPQQHAPAGGEDPSDQEP